MDDLALALSLADTADAISMARYRAADLRIETKPDRTPVTEADRAVELALRERLAEARPGDAVLGEEFGVLDGVSDAGAGTPHGGARRWVLDPIDGTMSYLRGLDTWSTLIALQAGDETLVGVVSMPALGRRWWASRGGGAFAGSLVAGGGEGGARRLRVSAIGELADAQLAWSGIESWDAIGRADALLALARRCWRTRGVGDAWQYMLVAEGAAEIATDPEAALWDMAAVAIVVQEAGGRFSDLHGRPGPDGGSGLASNGLLHEAALALIGHRA